MVDIGLVITIIVGVATVIGTLAGIAQWIESRKKRREEMDRESQESLPHAAVAEQYVQVVNLAPTPRKHFTGREVELRELTAQLLTGKSVAVTALQGMGGIGKTEMAARLAHNANEAFPGGVLWAELGQHPDVYGILARWAVAVGGEVMRYTDLLTRAEAVRRLLAPRERMLAVLDDVWEYDSANLLIRRALPMGVAVLITTRDADLATALGCQVEQIDVLPERDAVALLSKLVAPLDNYEATARELAQLVGYLPLALRIAAALARRRPGNLVRVVEKLRSRPMLGVLKMPKGEPRQKDVEVALALSYGELSAEMQRRFRALGAFALAPFDAAAVAAVWNEQDANAVADALDTLEAESLVAYAEESNVYSQHGLLRAYALALLEREGETVTVQGRHAAYYRALAKSGDWRATELAFEQVRQGWASVKERGTDVYGYFEDARRFLERRRWAEYLEWGRDALDWARRVGDRKAESELLSGMGYTYWKEAHYAEALGCLQDGLARSQEIDDRRTEASCLNRIGLVYRDQSQWTEALDHFEHSLSVCRQIGNELMEGYVLHNIGMTLFHQSRLSKALEHLRSSFNIFDRFVRLPVGTVDQEDRTQAQEGRALVLNTMGRVHYLMGQLDEAMDLWQRSLVLARDIGDRAGESRTLFNIGIVYLARGEPDKALGYFNDSLDISREIGHHRAVARAYNGIGEVNYLRGQYQEALAHCKQALEYHQGIGDRREEAIVLVSIGRVHLAQGVLERALTHFQDSLKIAREIGDVYGEGVALHYIARAHEEVGRASEAELAEQQAAAIFERLGVPRQESTWH